MSEWIAWLPGWFVAGGLVMWPLLACSVVTSVVFLEKLWTLRSRRVLQPDVARVVQLRASERRLGDAASHCRENPGPYAAIALAALDAAPFGPAEVRNAVSDAGRQVGARLERHLPVVRMVAAIAPLLGLLGTVLGMISVFAVISRSGLGQAGQLSGGIQEALLTTAFGLAIAIPSLLVHEGFRSRVDRLLLVMEHDIVELIGHLRGGVGTDSGRGAGPDSGRGAGTDSDRGAGPDAADGAGAGGASAERAGAGA